MTPGGTNSYGYIYDTYGNIRTKTHSYGNGTATENYTFTYGDAQWLDKLTQVSYTNTSGVTITEELSYDSIGNPTRYFNGQKVWEFDWQHGRQMESATSSGMSIVNTYDVDGVRETKTVNGVTHTYTTLDGKIVREAYGNKTIDYLYDNEGRPYKLIVNDNGTKYTGYYILNLQGDVIGIVDVNGVEAVTYDYDAWGKVRSSSIGGSYGSVLQSHNALKYRGYYYDVETGFYYVSSRYYDPEVGRFISPDTTDILEVQDDLYDKNLYAYCDNNPVTRVDSSGAVWHLAVGAAVGVATQFIADVGIGLATGSSFGEIMKSLSPVDYVSAAIGGAIAASGIGFVGAVVSNAALGGTTYLANCSYKGVEANAKDFVVSTAIGGVSGAIGGSGANGKNMRGVYSRSKQVINATKSARKQTMYKAKITTVKKNVTKSSVRTVVAGVFSNVGNFVRRLFSRSKA